jgi:hypothetical protein
LFLDVDTDPAPGPGSENGDWYVSSVAWAFNLADLVDPPPPPLEYSFDFFLLVFLGMSARLRAGDDDDDDSKGSTGCCLLDLVPSDESLRELLVDLLDCLGFSGFSDLLGDPVTAPVDDDDDDWRLDDRGNSSKSPAGEFGVLALLRAPESTFIWIKTIMQLLLTSPCMHEYTYVGGKFR